MADFSKYRETGGRVVDGAIQAVLKLTDMEPLSKALVEMEAEDRQIFVRNMSLRAGEALKKEIAELERHPKGTFRQRSERIQQKLLHMIEKRISLNQENEELTPAEVPPIRCKTEDELIETFTQLKRFVVRHGAVPLDAAISTDLPPLLKKGLELYVDGWDPSFVQSVLEQMKESLIQRYTNKQNMIVEGIGALMGEGLPQAVEERLRAFHLSD